MSHRSSQREFAAEVVKQLRDAGYDALWAGGCVRDQLLGIEPKDYDVATSARPEQVRELFGPRRTLAIGASFGVISVLGRKPRDPIEVATFRSDGAYLDGRHPSEVQFTTAKEDAQRRDFTINGLFYDPMGDKLIDYVDGERDLRSGIVRAIGDPAARFDEDKLRMLRAVRFATTFGFEINRETMAAIQTMAHEVKVVSAERIGIELRKILRHPQRAQGAQLLAEASLLGPLLPGVSTAAAAWQSTLDRLQAVATDSLPVAFAALLLHSNNSDAVRESGRSFRFTNKEIDRATWLVENFRLMEQATQLAWPRLQRVLVHEGADELLALAQAALGAEHPGVQLCWQRLNWPAEQLNPPHVLSGDDLVAHGLRPGKYFGPLLEELRDAQLENDITDRAAALDWVDRWLENHPTS